MDCPTCGKSLATERGMRQHHSKVHDESLPNRTCKGCGAGFYDSKSRRDNCDPNAGSNNGNWSDASESADCIRCGTTFEYCPSNKAGVYCSECVDGADEFLGTPSYENRDIERVETECEQCGEMFAVLATTFQREPCRFCSHECLCEWMSDELYEGERPPNVYNGDWWSVRRDARDRDDNKCQICGKGEAEIGHKPDVHHIEPIRIFDDPQEAHELSNVITLCRACHIKVEHGTLSCPKPDTSTESRKG